MPNPPPDISRIELRSGFLEPGANPARLPISLFVGQGITAEIAEAIRKEGILGLGGTWGLPGAGIPEEYDHLRIVGPGRTVEIIVHNLAISLFAGDDDRLNRIFRVLNVLKGVHAPIPPPPGPVIRNTAPAGVGRNDPCPCGSGKKYKRCCLPRGTSAPGPVEGTPLSGVIRELEGRTFDSLAEAQAVVDALTERENRAPRNDFSGFSADQMYRIIHHPFDSHDLVRFADSFTVPREAPMVALFDFLVGALGEKGVSATATGNLPRNLCKEAHGRFLPLLRTLSPSHLSKVPTEKDFFELHLVRLTAETAGLLRKYRGRFVLTALGRKAVNDPTGRLAYSALFRAHAGRRNWAFFDGYPEFDIIQGAFLYSLHLLQRHGDEFRPMEFYGDHFLRAFPRILDGCPEEPWRSPRQLAIAAHQVRTFDRFAFLFGLAELRPDPAGDRFHDAEIRKTPLLDDFVRFAAPGT